MDVSAAQRHEAKTAVAERYLETGWNYRMTDIQAAIGLIQLELMYLWLADENSVVATSPS